MRASDIFKDYVWLLNRLQRSGRPTFAEISDSWQRRSDGTGQPMSRTTFNRYRQSIAEIFGIEIACDRSAGNRYYIANQEIVTDTGLAEWMMMAIATKGVIQNNPKLVNRIMIERTPATGAVFQTIIEALDANKMLGLDYCSYEKQPRSYRLEPYGMRLYGRRWYLLGHFDEKFRLFSLDRIKKIKMLDDTFKLPRDFSIDEFFSEFYGIVTDHRVKPQRIVLKVKGRQRYYLRDLPLHHSQRIVADDDESTIFEYYLRPTSDFIMAVRAMGKDVEEMWPSLSGGDKAAGAD